MSIVRFLLVKLLTVAGTVLGVSALLFFGANAAPGNVANAALGPDASAAQIRQFDQQAGLDRPLLAQYLSWLGHAVRGDLGQSLVQSEPVTTVIRGPFGSTLVLVVIAGLLTILGALAVGVFSALRPGRVDTVLSVLAVTGVAIPQFVLAAISVLVFASLLHLLPAVSLVPFGGTPWTQPDILVLPAAVLTVFGVAWGSRLVRAVALDANASPHVQASRLAGLPEWTVLRRHLLPAIAGPVSQTLAWLVGALLGGTAVVERVFSYPGLSVPLINAVQTHDTPVVEGVGLLLAVVILLTLLVADVIGVLADPRMRTAR